VNSDGRTRVLFLNGGQGSKKSRMGSLKVDQTLRTALERLGDPLAAHFLRMPRFGPIGRSLVVPVPGLPGRGWSDLRWFLVRSASARRLVQRELAQRQLDVVHVTPHNHGLLLAGLQKRVPCVLGCDMLLEDWTRMRLQIPDGAPTPKPLRRLVEADHRALRAAPLLLPYTETVAAAMRRVAPHARIVTLHPGIDSERFRPPVSTSRRPGPRRVLFVGGKFSAKGGQALLDAVARVGGDVELHVVTTEAVPPAPGLVLHRAGPGSDELIRHFQDADVFCLPTEVDAVPWVLLEAMSCGVPVVSTSVGSIPEMVPPSCGVVIPPRDRDALAHALTELLESPERRREMSGAARAHVEQNYRMIANTSRLVELMEEVAADHRSR
jgi:glycosyltransferase involved in cell wall biosynthesis